MTGDVGYVVTIHEEWTSIRGLLLLSVMRKVIHPWKNWKFGVLMVKKRTLCSIDISGHEKFDIYPGASVLPSNRSEVQIEHQMIL